jgi:hypothetical protein
MTAAALVVAADALAGAGLALDDGVDDLEVGGVGGEADLDLGPVVVVEDGFVAEVILYVAVAPTVSGM